MMKSVKLSFILFISMWSVNAEVIARWDFENNLENTVGSSYGVVYTGSGSVVYSSDAKSGNSSFEFSNPGWGAAPSDKLSILDGGVWATSGSSWTFTAWVKPTTSSGTVFSARSTISNYGCYVDIRNGMLQVAWNGGAKGGGGSGSVSWGVREGIWSMLVVVFDVPASKITLYRYTDNVEGLVHLRDVNVATSFPHLTNFKLGYNDGTGNGFGGFSGRIDDVRIYGQALSKSEISLILPEFMAEDMAAGVILGKFADRQLDIYF